MLQIILRHWGADPSLEPNSIDLMEDTHSYGCQTSCQSFHKHEMNLWMIYARSVRRCIPANTKDLSKVTQTQGEKIHSKDCYRSCTRIWIKKKGNAKNKKKKRYIFRRRKKKKPMTLWIHSWRIFKLITSSIVRLVKASRVKTNSQKSLIKRWSAITFSKRASEWQLKSQHLGLVLLEFMEMEASFHGLVIVGWIFLSLNH